MSKETRYQQTRNDVKVNKREQLIRYGMYASDWFNSDEKAKKAKERLHTKPYYMIQEAKNK